MPLLAYNLTADPITLTGAPTAPLLPPSLSPPERGPAVNVTTDLKGLTMEDYGILQAQVVGIVDLVWTGEPEFVTPDLLPARASAVQVNFIYREGEPNPQDNVYATFEDAYNARQLVQGYATIEIDDYLDACWVPAGTWDMADTGLVGKQVGNGNVSLNFDESAFLVHWRDVRNLDCYSYNCCPIVTLDTDTEVLRMVNTTFWDERGGGFFQLYNALLVMYMSQGSGLFDDDGDVIKVDGSSCLVITAEGRGTVIGNYALGGGGVATVYLDAVATLDESQDINVLNIAYTEEADQVFYSPDNSDNWSDPPVTVAEGLDRLAARAYSTSNFIYREGASPHDNVYATFEAALTARRLIDGYATIEVDDSEGECWVSTGEWDMDNTGLVGRRGTEGTDNIALNFDTCAKFTNWRFVKDLDCVSWSSHPVVHLDNVVEIMEMVNANLWDEDGGGFFQLSNSADLTLSMRDGSGLYDDDGAVIIVDDGCDLVINAEGKNTHIGSWTLGGSGTAFVNRDGAAELDESQDISVLIIGYDEDAGQINYTVNAVDDWADAPITVAEALDDLAFRVPGDTVVYREGETNPGAGIYATFADAYAARQIIRGHATIAIDDSIDPCWVPAGDWDLDDTLLKGLIVNGDCNRTVLNLDDCAKFTNWREAANLKLLSWSSHPIVHLCNDKEQLRLTGTELWDENGGSFFRLTNSFLTLTMEDGATLTDDDGDVIFVDGDSFLILHATGADTEIGDNTLNGGGAAILVIDSAVNFDGNQGLSDISVAYSQDASQLNYDPDDSGNWLDDPSTVADGLDLTASRVQGLATTGAQYIAASINYTSFLSSVTPDASMDFAILDAPAGSVLLRADTQVAIAFDGTGGTVTLDFGGRTQVGIISLVGSSVTNSIVNPGSVTYDEIGGHSVILRVTPLAGQSLSQLTAGQVNFQMVYFVPPLAP